jgi:protein TonB
MTSLTRLLGDRETSVTVYRDASLDVYVEYDHRIDRRPAARAVLVRAALPDQPTGVESLVARFGVPDDGASDLAEGLHDGVAVWVDEPCGVVLTAYRPPASWWAAEGGPILQLETLNRALKGASPGSSKASAVLERKHGSGASSSPAGAPAATASPAPTNEVVGYWVEANGAPRVIEEASGTTTDAPSESEVAEVETDGAIPVTPLTMENETDEASSIAMDVPPASEPQPPPMEPVHEVPPIATDRPGAPVVPPSPRQLEIGPVTSASTAPPPAPPEPVQKPTPKPTAPPTPQTTETSRAPSVPHTIATWRAGAPANQAPTTAPKPTTQIAPQTIATWHPEVSAGATRASSTLPDGPAKRIEFVPPVHPRTARWLGKTGHVTLAIVVKADGTVAKGPRVMSVRPAGRGFAEAAIDAVQKWRFSPAIERGKPVASNITVDVQFE